MHQGFVEELNWAMKKCTTQNAIGMWQAMGVKKLLIGCMPSLVHAMPHVKTVTFFFHKTIDSVLFLQK